MCDDKEEQKSRKILNRSSNLSRLASQRGESPFQSFGFSSEESGQSLVGWYRHSTSKLYTMARSNSADGRTEAQAHLSQQENSYD